MSKKDQNIYLIDGHALCYRAYYAIRELSNSKGVPTNAVYGFINILRKLLREYDPEMMTVVFDKGAPTARIEKYAEYKAHRKPMPDDLFDQIAKIKEVVDAYRIPIFELEGYEADDVIATLALKAEKKGLKVIIVTADKDALQLVNENIKVLNLKTSGDVLVGEEQVEEKYGVKPTLMVDLMALTGDASDNVPGVKGVGPQTASKLIKQFGGLKNIYINIDKVMPETLRRKLVDNKEIAELSRELVELDKEAPVTLNAEETILGDPNIEKMVELFKEFEFEKLLREIMPKEEKKEGSYSICEDKDGVGKIAESIKQKKEFTFLIKYAEDEKNIEGITFSAKEQEAVYIPFKKDSSAYKQIKSIFEDKNIKKCGYNLKKTIIALSNEGIKAKGLNFDVMIADYLIDPSRPKHDIPGIAMRHLNINLQEEKKGVNWDDKGQGALDFSASVDYEHECESAAVIFDLEDALTKELKTKGLNELFRDVEMPLVDVLAEMELMGVGIDVEYLKKQSKIFEKNLGETSKKIHELAGEKFNINSPKQLQYILFEKLELPPSKKTKTGYSTDETVLNKLSESHEIAVDLLKYRQMNKLKTAYYDSILGLVNKKNNILYAHFNQAVTATGRLSSSDPNLQNIPIKTALGKEIRKAFVPIEAGDVLLCADYSQVELRVLAHLSGDKALVKAFKNNEDVHNFTASEIFGCKMKDVTGEMRSIAKTVNFGIVYGISAFGLAKDLGVEFYEAQKFIDSYFERYEGVKTFISDTIKKAKKSTYVTTILNRRRYIPEIKSSNERLQSFAERAAVNTPVQGSAADIIKLAMIECHNEFKDTKVKMISQVHDELVFSVPKKIVKEISEKVEKIMENVIKLEVPLKVDMEKGDNWLDLKKV